MLDSHGPAATFGRLLEDDALAVFSVTVIRLLRFCREKRSLLTQATSGLGIRIHSSDSINKS
jgi:chorismate-pyruvate lyase